MSEESGKCGYKIFDFSAISNGVRNIGLRFLYPYTRIEVRKRILGGDKDMKGYTVESGYMGYVNGVYMLFASETDYLDYMEK